MAKKLDEDVAELSRKVRTEVPPLEHRHVYNGPTSSGTQGYAIRPNRKGIDRKVSTFYLIALLFGAGVGIVGYVNNIIVVNRLSAEINQLQIQLDKISNSIAVLRAEIDGKSGRERIGKIAFEQIGLRDPKESPTLFDVDEDMMEQAKDLSPTNPAQTSAK